MAVQPPVTLSELSVTFDPNAAPDATPAPNTSPYAFSTLNVGNTVSNGSFANTPITTVPEVQTQTNQNTVSPGDLPWAVVLMPTTSAGQGGIGNNKHSLQPETWVYGIWADVDDCQQPLVIGVIPGSGGGSSSGDGSSSSSSGTTSSGSDNSTLPNVAPSKAIINQNTNIVYNTLRKNGFTHEQSCGIMGNIQIESGFNTGARNNIAGGHTGLVQWDSTRWARFNKMFPGQQGSAEAQTKFLIWEINNTHAGYARMIKMKTNDVTSAAIGMANIEMFGAYKGVPGWTSSRFKASGNLNGIPLNNGDLQRRIAAAKALAAKLGNNSSTTPSQPSTPAMNTPTS